MQIVNAIKKAQNIILSTHKSSDGDGLGSEIAMFHALHKIGKNVSFVHNDLIPSRYHFLLENTSSTNFLNLQDVPSTTIDLALIFDTHDPSLCSPLFEMLKAKNVPTYFIDHHIKIKNAPEDLFLLIDESASCTGEIVYDLICQMQIPLDARIASSLYASLIFDTQNFKVIRDSVRPFAMASQLLSVGINSQDIQDQLFANWTVQKMSYLGFLVERISYYENATIAVIRILKKDLLHFQVETEQVSDLVDFFMQIEHLNLAIVIREDSSAYHKLSFRSRRNTLALDWAREFLGGGHSTSAGAWVGKTLPEIESQIENLISQKK